MKRFFSFKGRIGRGEYALSYFGGTLAYGITLGLAERFQMVGWYVLTVLPVLVWFFFAQGAKRCHDRDNSGWFQLIPFYFLWMLLAPGYDGRTDYGPDPRW